MIEGEMPKPSPLSIARSKAAAGPGKRSQPVDEGCNMQAEVNQETVAQLKLQIALLQDQLAQITKNTEH